MATPDPVRRRTLNRDKVIAAAITIIDESGWDAMSMTRLAEQLGVVAASLYNHVRGLDDLRGAVQVATMRELGERLKEVAMGRTGAEGIRALARAHRDWAVGHPHRYHLLTVAPVDRAEFLTGALEVNRALGAMLASCGLEPERTRDAAVSMFAAMHGFAMLANNGFLDGIDADTVYESVLRGALAAIDGAAPKAGASTASSSS